LGHLGLLWETFTLYLVLSTVILVDFVVDKQNEDHGWYYLGYQMEDYQ
jgi:hypothetical protein